MSSPVKYKIIAAKIIELKNDDLTLRDKLIERGVLGEGYHKDMVDLHNRNAEILNNIMDEISYPTIDKVGEEAHEATWLIIQHAIGRPAFMKKCSKLLEEAVIENKANPLHLAYLNDRIAVHEGRPQLYGSQFDWNEKGELSPQLFDNLTKVNERRQAIGLNTIEDQTDIIRRRAINENQNPPLDYEKRKTEINNWRKSVGWKK